MDESKIPVIKYQSREPKNELERLILNARFDVIESDEKDDLTIVEIFDNLLMQVRKLDKC